MKSLYQLFKGNDLLPACYLLCMLLFSSVLTVTLFLPRASAPSSPALGVFAGEAPANVALSPGDSIRVSAQAACVIDGKSGKVIFGKNQNVRLPMASTTKIMTALVALEQLPLGRVIRVHREAAGVEGSSIYLTEGENITVESLLYGLMLESGNDAAAALAIAAAGSEEAFVGMMNDRASELLLTDSHFTNPHGLSDENHYTTAYELAALTAHALKNESFRRLVSSKNHTTVSVDGGVRRFFVNHNKLLRLFDGAIGVKTGYTKAAGRCLVSAAEREDEIYVAVTLNAPNDWQDHINLLDFSFFHYDSIKAAAKRVFTYSFGGRTFSNHEDIYLTVQADTKPKMSYQVEITPPTGGRVLCFADGVFLCEAPLLPVEEADAFGKPDPLAG